MSRKKQKTNRSEFAKIGKTCETCNVWFPGDFIRRYCLNNPDHQIQEINHALHFEQPPALPEVVVVVPPPQYEILIPDDDVFDNNDIEDGQQEPPQPVLQRISYDGEIPAELKECQMNNPDIRQSKSTLDGEVLDPDERTLYYVNLQEKMSKSNFKTNDMEAAALLPGTVENFMEKVEEAYQWQPDSPQVKLQKSIFFHGFY